MSLITRPTTQRRRAQERAERRAAISGSGPVRQERPIPLFPGATSWFNLFGEVLLVGILVTLASLPVITFPAALAAGVRHLRRFALAEDSWPLFWKDLGSALVGGIGVGVAALIAIVACLFDIGLASADPTPVGTVMRIIGVAGLSVVATLLLSCVSLWTPERGWTHAIKSVRESLDADPVGVIYLLIVATFVVLVTWQLLPLLVPALGLAALAIVAIPVRPRRRTRAE